MAAPVFTNFDFLDPYSFALKLQTALGAPLTNLNFGLLDPALGEKYINSVSSTPPFTNLRGSYDPHWTPGTPATGVNWCLADAIGSI